MPHTSLVARPWISLIPAVILVIFLGFYLAAESLFIECGDSTTSLVNCEPIEAGKLLVVPLQDPNQTPEANAQAAAPVLQRQARLGKQYSGRMVWMFFAAANVLFGVFVMAILFMIAKYWLQSWAWGGAVVVISIIGGSIISYRDDLLLAKPLFEATIQSNVTGIANFIEVNKALNSLAYGLGFALVLVVVSILFSRESGDNKEESLTTLAKKREHLSVALYGSTIALVVGLLRLDQGFTWATSFITDNTVESTAAAFYQSVTMTIGGFFTLLLTAVFLPVSFIIYERAKRHLSEGKYASSEVDSKLEESGFKFSLAEALPRLLAIAGPLLTGPIAELFKHLD